MTDIRAGSTQLTTHSARQEALLNTEVGEIFGVRTVEVTPRELEVAIALFNFGFSNAELAAHLCCSQQTIKAHLKSLYTKTGTRTGRELIVWMRTHSFVNNKGKTRSEMLPKVEKFFKDGLSYRRIASKLGISRQTVLTYLKLLRLNRCKNVDVAAIIRLRQQGLGVSAIARALKITNQTVYYHLRKEKLKGSFR